jgi:anaerobic magnesium-protoporphyrin IX monomethyl ester cyclase
MRILFVYPNINAQIGFNYGVAYISGLLKSHGMETFLLNVNEKLGYPLDLQRIKADVQKINPDIIGFSVLTTQNKYALAIAEDMKTYVNTPIIFGGIHPTMDPVETIRQTPIDCLCVGEGEEAFLEFAQRKGDPKGIKNLCYRQDGRIIQEPLRPYTDLQTLPFKDYEIFDFQQMIDAKDGWVGLQASRGCPFRCTYCLNHKIMGLYRGHGYLPREYLRRHTVEEVISEIEYLLSRYRTIKMFIFDDDIFTFDKEWLRQFSHEYRKVTDIGFVCNAHARVFDNDMAGMLKDAGCRIVKFGLESGSERIRRDILHRYMSNRQIETAFEVAERHGLHTSAFVMVGLPGENKGDIIETAKLLGRIRPGRFRWSLFFPFIGTRAYEIAKELNAIDFAKMDILDNFTDETCMRLGPDADLLIKKLKAMFCSFVNGYGDMDEGQLYRALVDDVERATEADWRKGRSLFLKRAEALDRRMDNEAKPYYRVKYNPFMGVRSDWEDDSLSA